MLGLLSLRVINPVKNASRVSFTRDISCWMHKSSALMRNSQGTVFQQRRSFGLKDVLEKAKQTKTKRLGGNQSKRGQESGKSGDKSGVKNGQGAKNSGDGRGGGASPKSGGKPHAQQKQKQNNNNKKNNKKKSFTNTKGGFDRAIPSAPSRLQQAIQNQLNQRGGGGAAMDGTSAAAVRDDVLGALAGGAVTGTATKETTDELTEGEVRYRKYMSRVKKKRDGLAWSYPGGDFRGSRSARGHRKAHPVPVSDAVPMTDLEAMRAALLADTSTGPHSSSPSFPSSSSAQKNKKAEPKKKAMIKISVNGIALKDLAKELSLKHAAVEEMVEGLGEDLSGVALVSDFIIDADVAELVALELGVEVERVEDRGTQLLAEASRRRGAGTGQDAVPRAPVVCIMGHVDHGKTTLLDTLRRASVADSEHGGITQKLSAFSVELDQHQLGKPGGKEVVFLDTPGHAAFTAMRSFGAQATDVVVLVVALDDGVRPQTKEAAQIAREMNCSLVVAVNKVDKIADEAKRAQARLNLLTELMSCDVVVEEFGGDVQVVEISGKTGAGIPALLDSILLQADMLELTAYLEGLAEATLLDTHVEKGRGTVVDLLIQAGELKVGDSVVVGSSYGKVKALTDSSGKTLDVARPPMPVRLRSVPGESKTGLELLAVENENKAREIAQRRGRVEELRRLSAMETAARLAAEDAALQAQLERDADEDGGGNGERSAALQGLTRERVRVVLKADGQGTLAALEKIVGNVKRLAEGEVDIEVVGKGVGNISLSDVHMLTADPLKAMGSSGEHSHNLILGFNVRTADNNTKAVAKQADISMTHHNIVYELETALCRLTNEVMPKHEVLTSVGSATCLKTFQLRDKAKSVVAGLSVRSGMLHCEGDYIFRVKRNGEYVVPRVGARRVKLRRFKDEVAEVMAGSDCGLTISRHSDFQPGDEVECFQLKFEAKQISMDSFR